MKDFKLLIEELRDDVTKLDNANIVLRKEIQAVREELKQHLIDVG